MSPEAPRRMNPDPSINNEQGADSLAVRTVIIKNLGTFTIPIKDHYNLWEDGLCRQTSQELFFPEKGEVATPAKKVCKQCPVKEACLEHALKKHEYGIWGGLSEQERKNLKKHLDGGSTRRKVA